MMYCKLFYTFLLMMVTVSFVYSSDVLIVDDREYEGLPEKRKEKSDKIVIEFGDEAESIYLRKSRQNWFIINFKIPEERSKPQKNANFKNSYRESFADIISVKIDDNDSNSIRKAIELYEKKGIMLYEKAGYPNDAEFTLKLNTERLYIRYGSLSKKEVFKDGSFEFNEYYNGIEIMNGGGHIRFQEGKIVMISLKIFADQGFPITKSEPEITFHDALKKYLSSLKKQIKIEEKPRGSLCYILISNQSLALCWKIDIAAGGDSRTVYINAMSGKVERINSNVAYHIISGTVRGNKYEIGVEEP